MAVSNPKVVKSSVANGVTTVFPYDFTLLHEDDLTVEINGVIQVGGYTVTGVGNPAGGNITFAVAPANLAVVLRYRNQPYTRSTDYQYGGQLPEKEVDDDFDRIWLGMQQLKEQQDRTPSIRKGETWGSGKVDFGGNGAVNVPTPSSPGDLVPYGWFQTNFLTDITAARDTAVAKAAEASSNAASVLAWLNEFKGRWYGPLASDPTLDPLGAAVNEGDAYWNTTTKQIRVFNGTTWVSVFAPNDSSLVTFLQAGAGAVSRTAQDKMREAVSIKDFGASVSASNAVNTAAVQAAAATGLPFTLAGLTVTLTSAVTLTSDLIGPGKLIAPGTVINIGANDVRIRGVSLEGNTPSGTNADIAVSAINYSGLRIEGCVITNARVRVRNTQASAQKNFHFLRNVVNVDFTNFDYIVTQNDVVTVRGINGVWIEDNVLNVTNCHRCFKIADTEDASSATTGTAYRSRNVNIKGNIITGSTGSGKQLIDLFSGTSDVCITGNAIDVTGFGAVIENKTGFTQTYEQDLVIANNIRLASDGLIIHLQGSHGATTSGYDTGYQNANITGNNLVRTGSGTTPLVSVRFYDEMIVSGNQCVSHTGFLGGIGFQVIEVLSCKHSKVVGNTVSHGMIYFSEATTNSAGEPFSADVRSIKANSNIISDFGGTSALGGVYINQMTAANCNADLSNNTIHQTTDDAAAAGGVALRNATLSKAVVTGNVSTMANAAENRLRLTGNTIGVIVEASNSWNVIGRVATTYDPPSLAAGATATTTVTVTGAAVATDWAEAQFSRALAGIVMTSWVSAADTVTVQFYNPTGGTLDLSSGTLSINVRRFTAPA